MKIDGNYTIIFQSRHGDVRLAQDVCRVVNKEYPHFSLTKFSPMFEKVYQNYALFPINISNLIINFNSNRPHKNENIFSYLTSIIDFAKKYNCYNCTESAFLCSMALNINCVDNPVICELWKGQQDVDHVICVYNRDGSTFDGNIRNNQTIILDAWAGLADFANNLLPFYDIILSGIGKNNCNKYQLKPICSFNMSKEEICSLSKCNLSLIV